MNANPPAQRSGWSTNDLRLLTVVSIWGINFTVMKYALGSFSPMAFNGLRFTAATVVMLGLLALRGESLRVARRDVLPIILLGLMGHTLYQVAFVNGLARTTAANSSLLMATAPIWVVVGGALLGSERAGRRVWAGILLSFAGILLLIGGGGGLQLPSANALGDLLVLGAAMLWAGYTAGSKMLLMRYTPLKLTALTMTAGTIPLFVLCLPAMRAQQWAAVPPVAWAGLAYAAGLSVVLAYLLWYTSVQKVGSARTAIYSNLTPVVAIIVAWIVLGNRLLPLQLLGAIVVLAGLLLTRQGRSARRPAPLAVSGSVTAREGDAWRG